MSTLSATRLSAKPVPRKLFINEPKDFVISFEQQNNETYVVIKFGVTAHGLKGRLATLTLVPPGYPQPVYPPGPALSQSFILVEGLQTKQFRLPLNAFPQVLGPPPKLFYVAVTCGRLVAVSDEFAFQPTSNACDCGHNLKEKFLTVAVTAGTGPLGPAYYGSERYKPRYYRGWPRLMDASLPDETRVTANERQIIETMAASEGPMDAVQSYDSEILSVGAMQKTISLPRGAGELNKQLFEFKSQHSSQFDCLIGKCGWDVTDEGNNKYRVTYTEAGSTPYGEQALMDKVRAKNNTVSGKSTKNPVIDCFIRLGRDETFQDKQIFDYVVRLRDMLQIVPVNSHLTP